MSVFRDKELETKFKTDGFVIIPFLGEEQINQLRELYRNVQPTSYPGFSSTIYSKDRNKKADVSAKIRSLVDENVNQLLHEFRSLGASFLCKTPGIDSEMPIHQDWSIVDESNYFSATIWVPLQDVDEKNGALSVIPGSHQFAKGMRGPSLPPLIDNVYHLLKEKLQLVPLKAGEAIVFNHALMHASPPNLSEKERWALTIGFIPKKASLQFAHRVNDTVHNFAIQDDFFLTYNSIGEAPEGASLINQVEFTNQLLTREQLFLAEHAYQMNKTSVMKTLFTDPEKQSFFQKNGFVKFPLLDKEQVDELLNFYSELEIKDHTGNGFTMSMEGDDKELVRKIRSKIMDIALPKAQQHFHDAKVITASYVIKENNPMGVVPPHQDWTFVNNEPENYSVTCWIPLQPTTIDNGCMGVIKGSHLLYDSHRPSPSPQVPTPLMNHLFGIFPYLEMIEMQPGEALVFDQRTFHASPPNITNDPRIAVGLGFTQRDAELCHLMLKPNGKKDTLVKYKIDEEFLVQYDNNILSKMYERGEEISGYKVLEEIPFTCPSESTESLIQRIVVAGNTYNEPLAEHMGKLFGGMVNNVGQQSTDKAEQREELSFWKVYTPLNIVREIRYRITGH